MSAFYFGDSAYPLYGVLHPPKTEVAEAAAVLLCYPFGQEYMRAHRAYRQLAMLLTRQGYHVLRFDYRGTGDSSGDIEDSRLENWLQDIAVAARELQQASDVNSVSIVGLRLGALLAALACERIENVDRLVLWDPVISGAGYVRELLESIANKPESRSSFVDEADNLHFNGFCLSSEFRSDIVDKSLLGMKPGVSQILQVVSNETKQLRELKSSWIGFKEYTYKHTAAPGDWNYVDNFGGILLPQPVIQGIVNWFVDSDSREKS